MDHFTQYAGNAVTALSAKLRAVAGDESIFAACDAMYRASFRSEPKSLGAAFSEYTYVMMEEEGYGDWFDLPDETLICALCNYKGEGEGGWVLYEEAKHLPKFVSKSASAAFVNA